MRFRWLSVILYFVSVLNGWGQVPVLHLDSPQQYATLDAPIRLQPPYTIEFWIQSFTADDHVVRAILADNQADTTQMAVTIVNGREIRLTQGGLHSPSYPFHEGWNHVAIVVRADHALLYLNGVFRGNRTGQFGSFRISDIGRYFDPASHDTVFFRGAITQLRFWNRVRSEEEIRSSLHLSSVSGTLATFDFRSVSGDTVEAAAGNRKLLLRNGAAVEHRAVPVVSFLTETAVAWKERPHARSGNLQISAAFTDAEQIAVIGYTGNVSLLEASEIAGIERQTKGYWGIVSKGLKRPLSLQLELLPQWVNAQACFLVDRTPQFANPVVIIGTVDRSHRTFSIPQLPFFADTMYVRFARSVKPIASIQLQSSSGFGPFMQGYKHYTTYQLDSLPVGADTLVFQLRSDSAVLQQQVSSAQQWSNVDMGRLPVGAYVHVRVTGDSNFPAQGYQIFQPISIAVPHPVIRSSFNFLPFFADLDTMVIFTITDLPPHTTRVVLRFAHSNGKTVEYLDSNGVRHRDSVAIAAGSGFLDSVSYTVRLGELQLPLSPLLKVTVYHTDGYPEGTTYQVGMDVLPTRFTIRSSDHFGPFQTNNYRRFRHNTRPIPPTPVRFTVHHLPRYTTRVRFEIVDSTGNILEQSEHSVANVEQVFADHSVESSAFDMAQLPVSVRWIQVRVFASGSADTGIVQRRSLIVVPPEPQMQVVDEQNRPWKTTTPVYARNPFDTADHHTVVRKFIIRTDWLDNTSSAVRLEFLDSAGHRIKSVSGHFRAITVPHNPGFFTVVRQATIEFDLASLPPTCIKVRAVIPSPALVEPLTVEKTLRIYPGSPVLRSPIPLDSLVSGQMWQIPIHLVQFPMEVDSLVINVEGPAQRSYGLYRTGGFLFNGASDRWTGGEVTELTISFWIRLNALVEEESEIISAVPDVLGVNWTVSVEKERKKRGENFFYSVANAVFKREYRHSGDGSIRTAIIKVPISTEFEIRSDIEKNPWRHVVFVAKFVDGKLKLYASVDGATSGENAPTATYSSALPLESPPNSIQVSPGDIPGNVAEVTIFQKALSAERIQQLPSVNLMDPIVQRQWQEDEALRFYFPLNFHPCEELTGKCPEILHNGRLFGRQSFIVHSPAARLHRPRWADTIRGPAIPSAYSVQITPNTAVSLQRGGSGAPYAAPTGPFTVLCWIKTTSREGGKILGFESTAAPGLNSRDYDRHLYMSTDGRLHFGIWSHSHGAQVLSTQHRYNDGQWHHVAASFEPTGTHKGIMRIFVDGVSIDEQEVWIDGSTYNGYWRIGRGRIQGWPDAPSQNRAMEGSITEIGVYSAALSGRESTALMYRTPPLEFSALQHSLSCADTSSAALYDRKTHQQNAVYGGMHRRQHTGTVHWATYQRNFGMLLPQISSGLPQTYQLSVRVFYRGAGPDTGVVYRYPLSVRALAFAREGGQNRDTIRNWTPIAAYADDGFGPFFEASQDPVRFAFRGMLHPWSVRRVVLRKSNGEQLASHSYTRTFTWQSPYGVALDVGEAEPGSYLELSVEEVDNPEVRRVTPFFLKVLPLVPPKIEGDFGPFDQAIAPGSMEQLQTFRIIEFADEVRMIAEYYDQRGILIRRDTARKVAGNDSLWLLTTPMGSLEPPTTNLVLKTYNSRSGDLLRSTTKPITIRRTRPDWFSAARFDNVSETTTTVDFTVKVPYNAPVEPQIWTVNPAVLTALVNPSATYLLGSGVPIFKGKPLGFPSNSFEVRCRYAKSRKALALISTPRTTMTLNIFGIPITRHFSWKERDGKAFYLLDSNQNLLAQQLFSFAFQQDLPTIRAMQGFLQAIGVLEKLEKDGDATIEPYVTIGFNFAFAQYVHHNLGYDAEKHRYGAKGVRAFTKSRLGFVREPLPYPEPEPDPDTVDVTQWAGYEVFQMGGGLTLSVGVSVAGGLAGLSLDITGRMLGGLGHQWKTVPDRWKSPLLPSITLQLYGKVVAHYLFLFSKTLYGPKMFLHLTEGYAFPELFPNQGHGIFGLLKSRLSSQKRGSPSWTLAPKRQAGTLFGTDELSSQVNRITPMLFPQPSVASADSVFLITWIEESFDDTRSIVLSQRHLGQKHFAAPVTIVTNRNAPTYPQLSYSGGPYAVVTWMQSRYTPETVPRELGPITFLESEDIWYAIYNVRTRQVEAVGMVPDNLDSLRSGRIEGKPAATVLNDEEILMVWHVRYGQSSDLLAVTIDRNSDGVWEVQMPPVLLATQFQDHEMVLNRIGNNAAVLSWIERDRQQGRVVSRVRSRVYYGSWKTPETLLHSGESTEHIVDIAQGFNHTGAGALLQISVDTVTKETVIRLLQWDTTAGRWDRMPLFEWRDSLSYCTLPRVAVNDNGVILAGYRRAWTSKIFGEHRSQIDLVAIDPKRQQQRHIMASPYVCDTAMQIYSFDFDFQTPQTINLFAHENNATAVGDTIQYGIRWGNRNMNLVLRTFRLDELLSVTDLPEDSVVVTGVRQRSSIASKFQVHLAPQPASEQVTVSFTVPAATETTVKLYTANGRKLRTILGPAVLSGEQHVNVPVREEAAGLYMLRFRIGEQVYYRQFLIVR